MKKLAHNSHKNNIKLEVKREKLSRDYENLFVCFGMFCQQIKSNAAAAASATAERDDKREICFACNRNIIINITNISSSSSNNIPSCSCSLSLFVHNFLPVLKQ